MFCPKCQSPSTPTLLFSLAQRNWGTIINPKPSIDGFSKRGVECVYVCECVCVCVRDTVEGQSTSRPVQIHTYSIRGWRGWYLSAVIIVTDSESLIKTAQIPGHLIESKPAVTSSFPADIFVCHWYFCPSPAPFSLPVTASSQTLSTQNLRMVLKSLWMIRIWLQLFHICCLSVSLRQNQMGVYCVWI